MSFSLPPIPDMATMREALEGFILAESSGVSYYCLPPELNYLVSLPEDPVPVLPPEFAFVAAFDSHGLAGRMGMVPLPHIEGTWVRPDLRGSRTGIKLLREIEKIVSDSGRTHVWAFAYDEQPEIRSYYERMGYVKMPLTVWVKDLTQESKPDKQSKKKG